MLLNYVKIALRNIIKHKLFSSINIIGLTLGLASSLIILLFVQDEFSYDKYHEKADRIFRVHREQTMAVPLTSHPYGPALKEEISEIDESIRFFFQEASIKHLSNEYLEETIVFTDKQVFDIFTWNLIQGDPHTALKEPNSIVITKETAEKYFGNENVLDKNLLINYGSFNLNCKITGVIEEIPSNSHFSFDFALSYSTLKSIRPDAIENWFFHSVYTYVLLNKNYDMQSIEDKFPGFLEKYMGDSYRQVNGENADIGSDVKMWLYPITDIHLKSNLQYEIAANGNYKIVLALVAVSILILLIASVNFMNLSLSKSMERAKEIGIRKVLGSKKKFIALQFLCESIVFCLIALALSIVILELSLPVVNSVVEKQLSFSYFNSPELFVLFLLITFALGLLSGSYPAFVLSNFRIVETIKGKLKYSSKGSLLRKVLVTTQFAVSIVLIISTIVIFKQIKFIKNKDLGFDKEQLIVFNIRDNSLFENIESVKSKLQQNSNVTNVTVSASVPGDDAFPKLPFFNPTINNSDDEFVGMYVMLADNDFLSAIDAEIIAGRDFNDQIVTDMEEGFILNESAVKTLGYSSNENAIDKRLSEIVNFSQKIMREGRVIGVVKDYNFQSLHNEIEPLVMYYRPQWFRYLTVKVNTEELTSTLNFVENAIKGFSPEYPVDYFFLNQSFESKYRAEEKLQSFLSYFTFLAIFIASLGLFGLSLYSTYQRKKEIGIKKILGASKTIIIANLSIEFLIPILIANIASWPLAYSLMQSWLADFAYRIDLTFDTFLLSAFIGVFIAMFAISFQAIKATLSNPINSIRYE